MKKFLLLFTILSTIHLNAQTPQGFNYSAVARDASGKALANRNIALQMSILKGSAGGAVQYSENHSLATDAYGLFNLVVGNGVVQSGNLSTIKWGADNYFLKTALDANGGTNFLTMGTTQLLSVPYALHAKNGIDRISGNGDTLYLSNGQTFIDEKGLLNGTTSGQIIYWDGTQWLNLNPGTHGQILTMCDGILTWSNGGICPPPAPVTDADGNVYPTVSIGSQIWMAENLKTTKYSDGSLISIIPDTLQWENNYNSSLSLPMMCWPNNDSVTNTLNKFGALYNWFVINPTTNGNKNICPNGWHVPSDAEWIILSNYLGGDTTAGGKLKSTGFTYWDVPNANATNESGFNALPAGFRERNGTFGSERHFTFFWSINASDANNGWARHLRYSYGIFHRIFNNKEKGHSVRCVKD